MRRSDAYASMLGNVGGDRDRATTGWNEGDAVVSSPWEEHAPQNPATFLGPGPSGYVQLCINT